VQRSFDRAAEFGARHEKRVHVDTVSVERHVGDFDLPVVDGDEHEIDVGLLPDGVVRKAAAENGGVDRAGTLHFGD